MASISTLLDLSLTEISIELLGNKIYDINGKRKGKLVDLFKASAEPVEEHKLENSNDFLCSLGYLSEYTKNGPGQAEFVLNDQFDYILENANTSSVTNKEIMETLRGYKEDQGKLVLDASEINCDKVFERSSIVLRLNKSRFKVNEKTRKLNTKMERAETMKKYYEDESNKLLQTSMDTLRLLKHILNDVKNDAVKGQLIAYIYAMRSVKSNYDNSTRPKPYHRPQYRASVYAKTAEATSK